MWRASRIPTARNSGDVQLAVTSLSVAPRTPFAMPLKDVSLAVRSGEILAIAGVAGNGQGELFDALSGEYPVASPEAIVIRRKAVGTQGITARRLLGASFVPEERHGHAAVPTMKLSDNLVLARSQSDRKAFLGGRLTQSHPPGNSEERCKTHLGSHGCSQERRGSSGRIALRRQSSEIHRRP